MTNYLVTGGAGFIGSHIAEALVKHGGKVRILDNLSTGRRVNMEPFADQVEFIEGDITDLDTVARAVEGVDTIFHQAALASVPRSIKVPLDTTAACVDGTVTVLDAARHAGVRRVVYAGSSSAYGDQPNSSKRETDLPAPISPYGAAKLAAEYFCQSFWESYGLETVTLRYFNVFGPRQDPGSPYSAVIPLFITAIMKGETPTIYGDGLQSRDFTFVGNVVDANLRAARADASLVAGQTINVANGRSIDLLTMLGTLNRLLGTDVQPMFEPARTGDVRESLADITQARMRLDYEPLVGLEEGLRRSIDYYRNSCQQAADSRQ